jgi:hypothetical protein
MEYGYGLRYCKYLIGACVLDMRRHDFLSPTLKKIYKGDMYRHRYNAINKCCYKFRALRFVYFSVLFCLETHPSSTLRGNVAEYERLHRPSDLYLHEL